MPKKSYSLSSSNFHSALSLLQFYILLDHLSLANILGPREMDKLYFLVSWIFQLCLSCCAQVWVICLTSDKKVKVEQIISKRSHKHIALRFWVRVRRLSCKCSCSSLDVDGPPGSPNDDPTVVSESRSTKGTTEAAGLFAQKAATTVQCRPVAEKLATEIQASKSFRLREEHDELMNSHLRGGVVCKCELYVPHRIKK